MQFTIPPRLLAAVAILFFTWATWLSGATIMQMANISAQKEKLHTLDQFSGEMHSGFEHVNKRLDDILMLMQQERSK